MNSKRYDGVNYPVRKVTDLKDLLFSSVEMFGDHPAYLVKDKEAGKFVPITYTEVGRDIQSLGTRLLDLGLADKKIGVIGENRYDWVLTYYAVVAGVGVIVPLDKNLPEGELLGLIERSEMEAIVFSEKERSKVEPLMEKGTAIRQFISMDLEEHEEKVLSLHQLIREGAEKLDAGDGRYMEREIDPDQMSTLLFTSGTTGLAKGVMLSHQNLAYNVQQLSAYFHIPDPGIVFNILPAHHVYAMTCDYWTTFYQGKTIAICEGLKYIQKNMTEVHPNVMLGVPLVFEKLYKGMLKTARRNGEEEKLRRAIDLSKRMKLYRNPALVRRMFASVHEAFGGDIKAFIEGGAAADPFIIEEFEAMGIPLIQGYGMSECSPIIALNRDRYRKAGTVGQVVQGAKVRLIDQDEDGVGEIIVKSPSVMMGYYENEEATEEAVQDGWLHTGDLGRFDEDGFLYITGRSKTVIVTKGGKNIFPEEVEEVLLKSDLIQEVVVHGVQDDRVGNVMITADIFPNYPLLKEQKGEMTRSEIYHFYKDLVDEMNELMPPYKQVKRVSVREHEFIKTTTGKIKRFGNRLSGAELAKADDGAVDYHDLKRLEKKRMKEFVQEIAQSNDPCYLHKDLRPVTDVRDLITESRELFRERTAFQQRFFQGGDYVRMTYQQAMADVEGLGTALMNRGFYRTRTALLGGNSYQSQISFLAAASGLGTAVPVDPLLMREVIEAQFKRAGVQAVIYDEKYAPVVKAIRDAGNTDLKMLIAYGPEDEARTLGEGPRTEAEDGTFSWHGLVEEGKNQAAQGDRQFLDAEVRGSDVCAIFFTSGRAGRAKAVPVTQKALMTDLIGCGALVGYTQEDAVFSVIPPNNLYQVCMGLLLPLYKGAAVTNFEGILTLEKDMTATAPTIFLAEPVILKELCDDIRTDIENEGQGGRLRRLSLLNRLTSRANVNVMQGFEKHVFRRLGGKIRLIISGGGAVSPEVLAFLSELGIPAIQGYGMSETTALCALNPDDVKLADPASCGKILPGIRMKAAGRGYNGEGEILVKGPTVMRGYLDDPEKTEQVLENGWFHTGDIGRVSENGFVYLTGRKVD